MDIGVYFYSQAINTNEVYNSQIVRSDIKKLVFRTEENIIFNEAKQKITVGFRYKKSFLT